MAPSPSFFRLVLLNVITNISPCLPSTIFALHTLEPVYAPPGAGMRQKKEPPHAFSVQQLPYGVSVLL